MPNSAMYAAPTLQGGPSSEGQEYLHASMSFSLKPNGRPTGVLTSVGRMTVDRTGHSATVADRSRTGWCLFVEFYSPTSQDAGPAARRIEPDVRKAND